MVKRQQLRVEMLIERRKWHLVREPRRNHTWRKWYFEDELSNTVQFVSQFEWSQECLTRITIQRLSHLADSPDSALSYFFLFGDFKEKLTDFDCQIWENLESAIITHFNEISKEIFVAILRSRMEWLQ
jgi:hypothetical protein